ncbi:Uncharacterised protein [Escherichia coli]|nr:Uncharacterised protein [Escherichia coli]SQZ75399.1 Uncharacterised protein [Escherichia coli]
MNAVEFTKWMAEQDITGADEKGCVLHGSAMDSQSKRGCKCSWR